MRVCTVPQAPAVVCTPRETDAREFHEILSVCREGNGVEALLIPVGGTTVSERMPALQAKRCREELRERSVRQTQVCIEKREREERQKVVRAW